MNNKIFELIQEQNGYRGLLWTEEDKREFAELIVRECLQMADQFELEVNRSGLVDRMKEHFGVEE